MAEYINRKDAINGFVQILKQSGDIYPTDITTMLQSIPPADVRSVVRGRWEVVDWVEYDGHGECVHYPKEGLCCTNCKNVFKKNLLWEYNYCPNCGADMREQEEKPKKDPFEGWSEELKETYRKLLASLHLEGGDAE